MKNNIKNIKEDDVLVKNNLFKFEFLIKFFHQSKKIMKRKVKKLFKETAKNLIKKIVLINFCKKKINFLGF